MLRTHRTTPARTRSASLQALTSLLLTTLRHLPHSSVLGAAGKEIRYADSMYAGTGLLLLEGGGREARYRRACWIVNAPTEEPIWRVISKIIQSEGKQAHKYDWSLSLDAFLNDLA